MRTHDIKPCFIKLHVDVGIHEWIPIGNNYGTPTNTYTEANGDGSVTVKVILNGKTVGVGQGVLPHEFDITEFLQDCKITLANCRHIL